MEVQKLSKELSIKMKEANKYDTDYSGWKNKIDEALKPLGFVYFTHGSERRVYKHVTENIVLKTSRCTDGNQNEEEVKLSKNIPKKLKKYFCLPLAYAEDYSWILMPKAQTYKDGIKAVEIEEKLEAIFEKAKFNLCDVHDENVGLIGKQMVVIDYGYGLRAY
jgi:hypothetical protein